MLGNITDIDYIIENCDNNGDGKINYTEFITATIDWKKSLDHERIERVFNVLDSDKSGKISFQEIKALSSDFTT
jgi:calcium-dependent protein kinase